METAILERLLEITVFSAVICLFVALFRWLLRRWLSPQLRYLIWFLVILRLLLPFTLESGIRLIRLPAEPATVAVSGASPLPTAPMIAAMPPEGDLPPPAAAAPQTPAAADPQGAPTRAPLSWRQWLLLLWGFGAAAVLTVHIVMTLRLNKRLRLIGRAPDSGTRRLYAEIRETLDVRGAPPILLLPDVTSPALTAQLRPRLLLPERLADGGAREETAFSLIHELTHYKRGDHLVCLLLVLLRAIWWFNPVVWILPPLLRADMESACDAQVVSRMDRGQKLRYANLLIELGQGE